MNVPRRRTVGDNSAKARRRSFSRTRPLVWGRAARGWGRATSRPAAPPDPPAIGFFILPVDLLQLAGRPLDGVLGLHALRSLGVHVGDDVLRVDLAGLGVGWPRVADHARGLGGRAVELHGGIELLPHGRALPEIGRA